MSPKGSLSQGSLAAEDSQREQVPLEAVATAVHAVALLWLSLGRAASGEQTGLLAFPLYGHTVTKQLQRAVKLCSRWKKSLGSFSPGRAPSEDEAGR